MDKRNPQVKFHIPDDEIYGETLLILELNFEECFCLFLKELVIPLSYFSLQVWWLLENEGSTYAWLDYQA